MKIEDLIFKDFFEQIIPNVTMIDVRGRQRFSVIKGILRFFFSCQQRHDGTYPYSICYDDNFLFDFEFEKKNQKSSYVIGYFEDKTQSPMAEDEKQDIKSFIEAFVNTDSEKTQNTIKALKKLIMELE